MIHKSSKKNKYDTKRALIIKTLAEKHKVSDSFVRAAIRGDRTSETAEAIRKEFKKMLDNLNTALS